MNRMQWLINDIQENTDCRPLGAQMVNFKLKVFPRGIVQAPTGYGKSAIIIRDIVDKVKYAMSQEKKLVITISTPLLVLYNIEKRAVIVNDYNISNLTGTTASIGTLYKGFCEYGCSDNFSLIVLVYGY